MGVTMSSHNDFEIVTLEDDENNADTTTLEIVENTTTHEISEADTTTDEVEVTTEEEKADITTSIIEDNDTTVKDDEIQEESSWQEKMPLESLYITAKKDDSLLENHENSSMKYDHENNEIEDVGENSHEITTIKDVDRISDENSTITKVENMKDSSNASSLNHYNTTVASNDTGFLDNIWSYLSG